MNRIGIAISGGPNPAEIVDLVVLAESLGYGRAWVAEVAASDPLPAAEHVLRFDFAYDGGKPGAGGVGRISLGGTKLAEGRIARTQPFIFSGDEGADVGEDLATPVTEDYQVPATFSGTIHKITIEVRPILAADRKAVDEAAIEGLQRQAAFE
jgi:hypothetical protein